MIKKLLTLCAAAAVTALAAYEDERAVMNRNTAALSAKDRADSTVITPKLGSDWYSAPSVS